MPTSDGSRVFIDNIQESLLCRASSWKLLQRDHSDANKTRSQIGYDPTCGKSDRGFQSGHIASIQNDWNNGQVFGDFIDI